MAHCLNCLKPFPISGNRHGKFTLCKVCASLKNSFEVFTQKLSFVADFKCKVCGSQWKLGVPNFNFRKQQCCSKKCSTKYSRKPWSEVKHLPGNIRRKQTRKLGVNWRLAHNLRNRLREMMVGKPKTDSAIRLLGCSVDEFKVHIQSQFKKGMAWNNYGTVWHIDHIQPCASFDLSNDLHTKICFHWTNMRPLFAKENKSKGDKIVVPQLSLPV